MLHIAICDDLQSDRLQIEKLIKCSQLKEDANINIISFENGESLVKYYFHAKPSFDIIFLDIYMNGENGIKAAKQIRKYDLNCKIIFITSSVEHALESFEVYPFNYLIKPITKNLFDSVFEKAIKELNIAKKKSLSVKIGPSIQTIFYKDILFIESDAKILTIHADKNKSFSFNSKLDNIEEQINDNRFIRCHKSFLVNMDYVSSLDNYSFKLIDDTQIAVTQRNFTIIKKVFYDYILDKADEKNNQYKVDKL